MNLIILSRNSALYSTTAIFNAAKRRGHSVLVMDHMRCTLGIGQGTPRVHYMDREVLGMEAIIPRIGSSATEYGAKVIRHFELQGVTSSLGSGALLRSRDKFHTLQLLASQGIPVPKTVMVNFGEEAGGALERLGGDRFVIKLLSSTHGAGVILAESFLNAESIIEAMLRMRKRLLVQEFIEEAKGEDIRIFVVGGEIVACMKRIAAPGEFRSNFHLGGSTSKVYLSSDEKQIALQAVSLLGLDVAGVDVLRSASGPLIIEVNASPGLEGIQKTTRIDIAKTIIQFVERRLRQNSQT